MGAKASVNEELALELHKPVIQKFKKRKVYRRIKYNIWAGYLAAMGSLPSKNGGIKYLYMVHDFTNYG